MNVVASKDEGFGLSIVEAAAHGVPTVTFSDLDAIPDLYDEKSMITITPRDDIALAKGIDVALSKIWDKEWIKKNVDRFSLDNMAMKYKAEYEKVLLQNGKFFFD